MKKQTPCGKSLQLISTSLSRSLWRRGFLLSAFSLAALVLLPTARAVSPPPDGGYPNETTAEGQDALFSLTTGFGNTALGFNALFSDTTGGDNTAVGKEALISNTTGGGNTAVGAGTLSDNTTGIQNTAIGDLALTSNTTGGLNTACGLGALFVNTSGGDNAAFGNSALEFNTTGSFNTASGVFAMSSNGTGNDNTATGFEALGGNTSGGNNTAIGYQALQSNNVGNFNSACGQGALNSNTSGTNNSALGQNALVGNTTGSGNVAIGSNAGFNLTTGNSNIDIANRGFPGEALTIRIGKVQTATFIAGISGATVPGGIGVIIDSTGHLGTTTSSARYKDNIRPMDKASEAILSLQPVTFRYKKALDPDGIHQFGLVAEQVEKVNRDLVVRDEQGKPYSVRYEAVNAMLLNEFLKEHHKVEEQQGTISELKSLVGQQQKEIETLTVGLQRVSNQLAAIQSPARVIVSK